MKKDLLAVKEVFYDLLATESEVEEPSVKANQQMALQVPKSLQEKGVVIIQNQSQVIQKKVVQLAVKGMRIIDDLLVEDVKPLKVIEAPKAISSDPIKECAKFMIAAKYTWAVAKELLQKELVREGLEFYPTKSSASKALGMGYPSFCSISKEIDSVYIDREERGMNNGKEE